MINQPTELPILGPLRIITAMMFGLLLLLILYTPMETHRRNREEAKQFIRDLIGPHALLFKCIVGIGIGLYVLGRICLFLGGWFEWPDLTAFGNTCKSLAMLPWLGLLLLLKSKAEAQENQRIGQALFGPRTLMSNTVNNYGINYGNQAAGQSVHQQARVDAVAINQQINSLVEQVEAETELDAARKREAVTELNTLTEQAKLPPAQREPSKILRALKLLPGLLSSINTLAQEWDKLEPWIRTHFGNI